MLDGSPSESAWYQRNYAPVDRQAIAAQLVRKLSTPPETALLAVDKILALQPTVTAFVSILAEKEIGTPTDLQTISPVLEEKAPSVPLPIDPPKTSILQKAQIFFTRLSIAIGQNTP